VIHPVADLYTRNAVDVKLCPLGEVQGFQLHHTVVLGTVGDVDALVDGQTVDLPILVVNVGTERRDTVGAKENTVRSAFVNLKECFLATH